jgi:argininosuccinate lyase
MPQKKNPDLLELVRAQAGVALGPLVTLAAILKGLPAGYNRDLQEDKAPMFTALDAADAAVDAMTLAISRLTVHTDRMEAALRGGYLTATEVADYLVRRGVPFRQAHDLAGKAVLAAEAAGCELWELPLAAYKKIAPEFDEDVLQAATPSGAVAAKDVPGGTAPARVMEALEAARAVAVAHRSWVEQAAATQTAAEARLLAAAPS